jgi:hypothetical protein
MIFIAKPKGCAIAEKDASENRIYDGATVSRVR